MLDERLINGGKMEQRVLEQYLEDIVRIESQKLIAQTTYRRFLEKEKRNEANQHAYAVRPDMKIKWKRIIIGYFLAAVAAQICLSVMGISGKESEAGVICMSAYGIWALYIAWCFVSAKNEQKKAYAKNQEWAENKIRMGIRELPQIQRAEQQLLVAYNECENSLNKLYGIGIIYPKYRSLNACGMFLEYLKSGRTHSLQQIGGDEGAYNLYDKELKYNHISSQLDQIQENQRILYQEVCAINENIERLCSSIERVEKSVNKIAQCTEINTWCNSANAINIAAMRRMSEDYYRYRR